MSKLLLPAVAAAVLFAAACGGSGESSEPVATTEVQMVKSYRFDPKVIEITAGDTVTWTNQDEVPHTATGQDRDVLQSGTISPGASFSQVFPEAGEFGYFCEFHPNMTGTIVVQ